MIMKSISLLSFTKMMSECVCTLYVCLSDFYNIFFVDLGITKRLFFIKIGLEVAQKCVIALFLYKKTYFIVHIYYVDDSNGSTRSFGMYNERKNMFSYK